MRPLGHLRGPWLGCGSIRTWSPPSVPERAVPALLSCRRCCPPCLSGHLWACPPRSPWGPTSPSSCSPSRWTRPSTSWAVLPCPLLWEVFPQDCPLPSGGLLSFHICEGVQVDALATHLQALVLGMSVTLLGSAFSSRWARPTRHCSPGEGTPQDACHHHEPASGPGMGGCTAAGQGEALGSRGLAQASAHLVGRC